MRMIDAAMMIGLILVPHFVNAEEKKESVTQTEMSEKGKEAYEILLKAESFDDTSVGITGRMPEEIKAWGVLLEEKKSREIFQDLLGKATLPGQLYALTGLYFADPSKFDSYVEKYKSICEPVSHMQGRILDTVKACDLVSSKFWSKDIKSGKYPKAFKEAVLKAKR